MSENFVKTVDSETGKETYSIQFDFGTQKIEVGGDKQIVLDFLHNKEFREDFSRVGDDLVIGKDNVYYAAANPLGSGHDKEVWDVVKTDEGYTITKDIYRWEGCDKGYSDEVASSETVQMTEQEFVELQAEHKITLNLGKNTVYATWAVLPKINKMYHLDDRAFYAPYNGVIILADYFKHGGDNIFVGDKSLKEILSNPDYKNLFKVRPVKPMTVFDTEGSDNLYGADKSDKIYSYHGDDVIDAAKGNDKIFLGKGGNKEIIINQGDGKDTVYNFYKAESVKLKFDSDDIKYTKSGNNLVINRGYDEGVEKTVINNYFKNYGKDNNIIISQDENTLVSDLTEAFKNGDAHLTINTKSRTIKGTNLSDEAFSSKKNETFDLKKGHDVIHFSSNDGIQMNPYKFGKDTVKLTKGSHLTLDIEEGQGTKIFCTRKGNDAVVTVRHSIDNCGVSYGKEEWVVKKASDGTYKITKTEYDFNGNGYTKSNLNSTVETMTKEEFKDFQKENGIKLKLGKNTLYTSAPVVPEPQKTYSKTDMADYGEFLGSVTLKDYFKYGEDSVYIGDKSLQDYPGMKSGMSCQRLYRVSETHIQHFIPADYLNRINQDLIAWQKIDKGIFMESPDSVQTQIKHILAPVENPHVDIN